MARLLAALTVPAVLLAVAPAAPVPKERPKPVYYFPTGVGDAWVYDMGGQDLVQFVSAAQVRGEVTVVEVSHLPVPGARPAVCEVVEVSARGVARTRSGPTTYDPPFTLLRLPAVPGEGWAGADDPGGRLRSEATARGAEAVEVPAGRFEAARVDWVTTGGAGRHACSVWFAPGVGEVKSTVNGKDAKVLKSFTKGKK